MTHLLLLIVFDNIRLKSKEMHSALCLVRKNYYASGKSETNLFRFENSVLFVNLESGY